MPIKITREEYEKKFGVAPGASPSQPIASEPKVDNRNAYQKYADFSRSAVSGIAKGGAETLQNVGNFIAKPLNKAMPLTSGTPGLPKESFAPKNTTEKFFKGAERVAEFAAPIGQVSKIGQVAKTAPFVQKAVGLGKRAFAEGAVGGGVTAAQTGEVDRETRDVAIISGLFPVAGKVIKSTSQVFRNPKNGARVIDSLIRPLLKDLSYGKNPGRAISEEGIIANNFDELVNKVSIKKDQIGQRIEQMLSTPEAKNIRLDVSGLINPLNEATSRARNAPLTNAPVLQRLKDTVHDILGLSIDEKGNAVMKRRLTNITPLEATEIKRLIGDITKFTGNQSDDQIVNKALKSAYGIVKGKIDEAVPAIKPLNERYADLLSAKIASEYRDKILQRQNLIKLVPKLSTVGGLLTSAATMNPLPLIAGLTEAGAQKMLESPAFKTRFAKWLSTASVEEKKKLIQKAPWMKAFILKTYKDNN